MSSERPNAAHERHTPAIRTRRAIHRACDNAFPPTGSPEHALAAGQTLELHLEELDVSGTAWIEAIEPCPEIEPGPGRVVL